MEFRRPGGDQEEGRDATRQQRQEQHTEADHRRDEARRRAFALVFKLFGQVFVRPEVYGILAEVEVVRVELVLKAKVICTCVPEVIPAKQVVLVDVEVVIETCARRGISEKVIISKVVLSEVKVVVVEQVVVVVAHSPFPLVLWRGGVFRWPNLHWRCKVSPSTRRICFVWIANEHGKPGTLHTAFNLSHVG